MACSFEVEAMVRGYHQYKEISDAEVGKKLECQRETGNPQDIFAVAVLKSGVIVGHVPRKSPQSVRCFCGVEEQFTVG